MANAGQCEIGTKFSTLTQRADWTQVLKYIVHNVSHQYGKTATFMPKPIVGDNGSGMHVHQSIWKDGQNLFAGNGYAGLSEMACTTSAASSSTPVRSTPSPTRVPTPTSAWCRTTRPDQAGLLGLQPLGIDPHPLHRQPERSSYRGALPGSPGQPLPVLSALMMAGLDGIQNKIHPGDPADKNLYDLPPEEGMRRSRPCTSLDQALEYLDKDREFLTRGGVFSNDFIDAYIALKGEENRLRVTTHPVEFDLYYSL